MTGAKGGCLAHWATQVSLRGVILIYYFGEHRSRGGAAGEGERIPSSLHVERGVWHGSWSHAPEIMTWANSGARCWTSWAIHAPLCGASLKSPLLWLLGFVSGSGHCSEMLLKVLGEAMEPVWTRIWMDSVKLSRITMVHLRKSLKWSRLNLKAAGEISQVFSKTCDPKTYLVLTNLSATWRWHLIIKTKS